MHQPTVGDLPWELLPLRDELYPAHSFSLISAAVPLNKPFILPISSPSSELCLFPGLDKPSPEPENKSHWGSAEFLRDQCWPGAVLRTQCPVFEQWIQAALGREQTENKSWYSS